jgi:hypothetical protein
MAIVDNIVTYYKLENVNDSAGSSTLTNRGTTAFNTGKIDNAADTGASNSTKNLYCSPQLTYAQIGSGFTFSFWANVTTSTSAQIVLRHVVNNGSLERGFYVQQTAGGKWLFSLFDGSGHDITSTTSVATSTWVYITCVYTGSVQRLYINGVEEGTALTYTMSGYSRSTLSCFSLGAYQDTTGGGASNWYSGLIDEVGIWSRALTSTEITELYNSGSGLQYPFSASGPANLKSYNTNVIANIKSINTNLIANVKSLNTNV